MNTYLRTQWMNVVGIAAAFLFGLLIIMPVPASATGIVPALREVPDIAAGTSVDTFVLISRSDSLDEPAYAEVYFTGEAAEFIEHLDETDKEYEPGMSSIQHNIRINTEIEDEDGNTITLPEGEYTAAIRVGQKPPEEGIASDPDAPSKGGATSGTISLSGAQGDIWFSVTNDTIEEYSIETLSAANTEERLPVVVTYRMVNEGNVSARPARIELVFAGVTDTFELETTILAEDMPFVLPYGQEEVSITTDVDLPAGRYNIEATFYDKKDEVVYVHEEATLQVFPAGTLDQRAELVLFETDKQEYEAAQVVEFIGQVENTGTIGLLGSLIIEVEKNGEKIDFLTSDEVFIAVNRTAELDFAFNPEVGGDFTAKGYFKYGPYKTDETEIGFSVEDLGNMTVLVAIGVLILIIVIIVLLWKRRMKKRAGGGAAQSVAPAQPQQPSAPAQPAAEQAAAPAQDVAAMQKQLEEMQKQLEEMQKQLAAATTQSATAEAPAEETPTEESTDNTQ